MFSNKFEIGSIVEEDLYSTRGILLLKKGTVLNSTHVLLLTHHDVICQKEPIKDSISILKKQYQDCIDELKKQYEGIYDQDELSQEEAEWLSQKFGNLYRDFSEQSLDVISLKEQFENDEYIYQHSINVGLIASKIGEIMGLNSEKQLLLAHMGLFHDIGKFKIDLRILNKPTRLTDEEFNEIRHHPLYGYEYLKNSGLPTEILLGVLLHHERLDGSGYPQKVPSEKIPYLVRILSVADTFDAICSKRSYKGKKSFLFAIEELLKDAKRNLLDQEIVQRFSAHIMESIKKKELKLRNGKSAEIIYVFLDSPTQPILSVEGSPLNLKKAGLTIDQVAIL